MQLLGRYRVVYRIDGEIEKVMYMITSVMSDRTPWFVIFEQIPENTQAHIHTKQEKYFSMNFFQPIEWLSGKESACQCRRCMRHRFDPWIGKIP